MKTSLQMIPFVKASACGNDFLIVDGKYAPADIGKVSQQICDRHNGVGADGVEWLFPTTDADVHARLINADGSEAEISGNGTRCVAAHLCAENNKDKIVIRTGAGLKTCTLLGHNGVQYEFEIVMGEPRVDGELKIKLASHEVSGVSVSMGNPHYVVFIPEFVNGWQDESIAIAQSGHFKEGVNVEWVVVRDQSNIEVRFFERGAGETQSSGTGSCASAVAAISTQRAISPVKVHAEGGTQTVRWDKQIFLQGTAQLICRGEYYLPGDSR